jgi:hypothetical protein
MEKKKPASKQVEFYLLVKSIITEIKEYLKSAEEEVKYILVYPDLVSRRELIELIVGMKKVFETPDNRTNKRKLKVFEDYELSTDEHVPQITAELPPEVTDDRVKDFRHNMAYTLSEIYTKLDSMMNKCEERELTQSIQIGKIIRDAKEVCSDLSRNY